MDIFKSDAFQADAFQLTGDAAAEFAFQMCAFDSGGFQADVCTNPPEPEPEDLFEDCVLILRRTGRR